MYLVVCFFVGQDVDQTPAPLVGYIYGAPRDLGSFFGAQKRLLCAADIVVPSKDTTSRNTPRDLQLVYILYFFQYVSDGVPKQKPATENNISVGGL